MGGKSWSVSVVCYKTKREVSALPRELKTVTHREAEIAGIGIRQLIVERSDDVAVRRADTSDAVLLVAAIHDMAV